MDCREFFFRNLIPSLAAGLTFGDWMRLLSQNRFRVHPRYWAKVVSGTLCGLINTPFRWLEHAVYGRRVAAEVIHPPLFVLGHWRSGTTHLQNLLAIDGRFAYPKLCQTAAPHTFLLTERVVTAIGSWLLPRTRYPVDNVSFGPNVPFEEEFALCSMTSLSPYMTWAFPRRADHYDRYLTFRTSRVAVLAFTCVGNRPLHYWTAPKVQRADTSTQIRSHAKAAVYWV